MSESQLPSSPSSSAADPLVHAIRTRLAGAFPAMFRSAIEAVGDDGLWWSPAPGVNPIGVLAMHCAGNLRHFIGTPWGGIAYVRDRPLEFDASRRLSVREVLAEFNGAVEVVAQALDGMTDAMLAGPARDPSGRHATLLEDLLNAVTHLAFHAGQAVQLARQQGAPLPSEPWGAAHRASGAWPAGS